MLARTRLINCGAISLVLLLLMGSSAAGDTIYVDESAPAGGNGQSWATAYKYLQDGLADANVSGKDIWVAAGTYKPVKPYPTIEDLVTFSTSVDYASDIALDVAGGKMYWTRDHYSHYNKIQRANLDGSNVEDLVTFDTGMCVGIALDVSAGKMYWTKADEPYCKIQRANLDGSSVEDLVTGLDVWSRDIALDVSAGKMYWPEGDNIRRANMSDGSGVEDLVILDLGSVIAIALDVSAGKMYWAKYEVGSPDRYEIERANMDDGSLKELLFSDYQNRIRGIALDVSNYEMYWTVDTYPYFGMTTGEIRRDNMDGSTGPSGTRLVDCIAWPTRIALDMSGGKMYWIDRLSNMIRRVDMPGFPYFPEETFQLLNGVAIYGGFAGGETSLDERDWVTNETILSGNILRPGVCKNSDAVVTGSGTNETAVLHGFTIDGGDSGMVNSHGSPTVTNCTFSGTGMYNDNSSPMVTYCTFSGNWTYDGGGISNYNGSNPTVTNCNFIGNTAAADHGGGMYNSNSNPTVTNCTFSGNTANSDGGGMYNSNSSPMVTNCTFIHNTTDYGDGGGMCNDSNSSPTVTDCNFIDNTGNGDGGGMCNDSNSSPTVTNCTFSDNTANTTGYQGRGGGMYNSNSSPSVTNCTFSGNLARHSGGGGMYNSSGSPTLTNCSFTGNSGNSGGGMRNSNSSPTVTNCTFSGNRASHGSGMANGNSSSPMLTNCTFTGNAAGEYGGGMRNYDSSPTVTNCTFIDNQGNCGGGMRNRNSSPTVTNCTFIHNTGHYYGGGMCNDINSSPTVTNCTFSGNEAGEYGAGMYNTNSSSPMLTNCTFTGNTASTNGGGMANYNSSPTVTNCILWGDTPNEFYNSGGSPTVTFSDVQGGYGGSGNIDDDPGFVDANGPDDSVGTEDDNLRLWYDSPCIDAGDETAIPPDTADLDGDGDTSEPTPYDLDGNPRVVNGVVDMGAYEGGYLECNPCEISTAEQMNAIGTSPNYWDKNFILTADIDLSGYTGTAFNIIGNLGTPFTGSFDGDGHTISNFTYTSTDTDYIALFGYVGSGGEIKDLGMANVNVNAGSGNEDGGLVGFNAGTVSNCYAKGTVTATGVRVGGLVGRNMGTVSNCYATGDVTGYRWVGGLVGLNTSTITNCYATVTATGDNVGGLVGSNA